MAPTKYVIFFGTEDEEDVKMVAVGEYITRELATEALETEGKYPGDVATLYRGAIGEDLEFIKEVSHGVDTETRLKAPRWNPTRRAS